MVHSVRQHGIRAGANTIHGGRGSDTFCAIRPVMPPLPSPGSSQPPQSLILNARDRLTRSDQDPVRILVTGLSLSPLTSLGTFPPSYPPDFL